MLCYNKIQDLFKREKYGIIRMQKKGPEHSFGPFFIKIILKILHFPMDKRKNIVYNAIVINNINSYLGINSSKLKGDLTS